MNWKNMKLKLYVVTVLLIFLHLASCRAEDSPLSICDNGLANIEVDLLSKDVRCYEDRIVIHQYYKPAGETQCHDKYDITDGRPLCMSDTISYKAPVPTSGDYRPLPPKYGEYNYLPPQRWLHSLKYGAIVFLYHPCAPLDQVMELKRLARSCLWKHIITPSPHLPTDKPFALVSWGCMYLLTWVDWEPAQEWIRTHSLQTVESIIIQDGQYQHGLIEPSYIVSTPNDSVVCPSTSGNDGAGQETAGNIPPDKEDEQSVNNDVHKQEPNSTTETHSADNNNTATNDEDQTDVAVNNEASSSDDNKNGYSNNCTETASDPFMCTNHSYVVVVLHNYPLLYGLITLLILVIVTLSVFLVCFCYSRNSSSSSLCCIFGGSRKRPLGRYKPCGQFYNKAGSGLVTGIAIPELGLPKTVQSEREKLLLESDEDDL